jgi:L-ascorbate metabolism protein UlaG (beta-lactamase superfamily)
MPVPLVQFHYLGHSSFVLRFASGATVLTDYGQSNSYGLGNRIHDLGALLPDVVLYSHHDLDHDRGASFPQATILDGSGPGGDVSIAGVTFRPFKTTEHSEGDNTSYLISSARLEILFAGDCQGEIAAVATTAGRRRIEGLFPRRIDLLMIPVDWVRPIAAEAAAFVDLLQPDRVIPMHYWSPQAKLAFLERLQLQETGDGRRYRVERPSGPRYSIDGQSEPSAPIAVISLEPAPYDP